MSKAQNLTATKSLAKKAAKARGLEAMEIIMLGVFFVIAMIPLIGTFKDKMGENFSNVANRVYSGN